MLTVQFGHSKAKNLLRSSQRKCLSTSSWLFLPTARVILLSVFWRRQWEGHDGLVVLCADVWWRATSFTWVSRAVPQPPQWAKGRVVAMLPGSCCQEPVEVQGGAWWPEQGWRQQVLQLSVTLLSRTCCTPGKYKQLSDVNWDYPVGGPGPGPNICFFCPPPHRVQHGFIGCFEAQFTEHAGSGGEGGWQCLLGMNWECSLWGTRQDLELEPVCFAGLPGTVLAHR